jgi:hypothetical protein
MSDMASPTRQEILSLIQGDWAEYIHEFRSLSPEAQSAFLSQQGYARFADLLAHIVAWWKVCHQAVERYVADPATQPMEYDVDAFNARAVAEVSQLDDEQVIESFEKMRRFMFEFVRGLHDTAFDNERVINQLEMDFVGHLDEHKIEQGDQAV